MKMGVEVGWLLQQHEIEGMKLIAGEKGLQKVMEKVNLLDNPDMIRWIKDGEFLITAGYILNEDQQLQQTFISELAKHHCVGLGIKLKRYMDKVPQVMLEQAEEYSLPIIELPYDRSFAEITSFLYRRIFRQEISEEKQYALIYNRISEIVIRDRGRQELLQAIGDVVYDPLLLTDSELILQDYRWHGHFIEEMGEKIHLDTGEKIFPDLLVGEILQEYQKRKFEVLIKEIRCGEQKISAILFPVTEKDALLGFMVFLENEQPFDRQLYDFASGIKPVMALEFLRNSLQRQEKSNLKYYFLKTILFDETLSREDIIRECKRYDFDYTKKYACAVVCLAEERVFEANARKNLKDLKHIIFDEVEKNVSGYELKYYRVYHNNSIILFFEFPNGSDREENYGILTRILQEISNRMQKNGIWLESGVSKIVCGVDEIRNCYYHALDALSMGRRVEKNGSVYLYHRQEPLHILQRALSEKEQEQIYEETIACLDRYDRENNTDFLYTLEKYMENNYSVVQTAEELFIHRNTMTGRLNKITELLNMDWQDARKCQMLRIGIDIRKLLERRESDEG